LKKFVASKIRIPSQLSFSNCRITTTIYLSLFFLWKKKKKVRKTCPYLLRKFHDSCLNLDVRNALLHHSVITHTYIHTYIKLLIFYRIIIHKYLRPLYARLQNSRMCFKGKSLYCLVSKLEKFRQTFWMKNWDK